MRFESDLDQRDHDHGPDEPMPAEERCCVGKGCGEVYEVKPDSHPFLCDACLERAFWFSVDRTRAQHLGRTA